MNLSSASRTPIEPGTSQYRILPSWLMWAKYRRMRLPATLAPACPCESWCTGRRSPELGLRGRRHAAHWPRATSIDATASDDGSARSEARFPPRSWPPRCRGPIAEYANRSDDFHQGTTGLPWSYQTALSASGSYASLAFGRIYESTWVGTRTPDLRIMRPLPGCQNLLTCERVRFTTLGPGSATGSSWLENENRIGPGRGHAFPAW